MGIDYFTEWVKAKKTQPTLREICYDENTGRNVLKMKCVN